MSRPTFIGFEAAKTGVFASQKALDIVGNNFANINTEGYTRQIVDQTSQSVAGYYSRLKLANTEFSLFVAVSFNYVTNSCRLAALRANELYL